MQSRDVISTALVDGSLGVPTGGGRVPAYVESRGVELSPARLARSNVWEKRTG